MKISDASLPLFRIFRVPVQAHYSWMGYIAGSMVWAYYSMGDLEAAEAMGIILAILYGSMVIHELAHALTARLLGHRVRRILLLPYACTTEIEEIPVGWHEVYVSLAGPAANIALAVMSLPALHSFWRHPGLHSLLHALRASYSFGAMVCFFNVLLGCVNLVPCFPLDGGRILRSILTLLIGRVKGFHAHKSYRVATLIAVRFIAVPIALLAMVVCFHFHDWIDLVLVGLVLVAGHCELLKVEDEEEDESCNVHDLTAFFANRALAEE